MKTQNLTVKAVSRGLTLALSTMCIAITSACANFSGIHDDRQMSTPEHYTSSQSLPAERGHWPSAGWADQFGDSQLSALIAEALGGSPTLEQARARVAAAEAFSETATAKTLPHIDADNALTRTQYSANALVPPPYAGSWQTENRGLLSASFDLDLWGKNREALKASVSQTEAARADAEMVRLTLTEAIARTYNRLALQFVLHDMAEREVRNREAVNAIESRRVASGLDTEVQHKLAQTRLSASKSKLVGLDGSILATRYQLASLMGEGPDRGLSIARPALGMGNDIRLPDNLPADLVSRRPDIVAARWRVVSLTHEVKVAKAEFYPDINLSAAVGLDVLGLGRLLTAASRTASMGAAIHLPIFDAGALRAQLKGRYAEYDGAVARYNQTLLTALGQVATQIAELRTTDVQLNDARDAQNAARQANHLASLQFQTGIANQLTALDADLNTLAAEASVADLEMRRRDRQIQLAAALGGGFVDASVAHPRNTPAAVAAR